MNDRSSDSRAQPPFRKRAAQAVAGVLSALVQRTAPLALAGKILAVAIALIGFGNLMAAWQYWKRYRDTQVSNDEPVADGAGEFSSAEQQTLLVLEERAAGLMWGALAMLVVAGCSSLPRHGGGTTAGRRRTLCAVASLALSC